MQSAGDDTEKHGDDTERLSRLVSFPTFTARRHVWIGLRRRKEDRGVEGVDGGGGGEQAIAEYGVTSVTIGGTRGLKLVVMVAKKCWRIK